MATLLHWTGTKEIVVPKDPINGFTLDELYKHIQTNMVEMVRLRDGRTMWIDEEGKFNQPNHVNHAATRLLQQAGGIPGDYIAGNALIAERDGEVQ